MPSAQQTATATATQSQDKSEQLNVGTSSSNQQATGGNKTPQELPEFIKQSLAVVEKKLRNLEKRRSKLDEYRQLQQKGQELNADQLSAVSKSEEVKVCIELMKDVEKQLTGFGNDALKTQKKQAKKEQQERDEWFKDRLKEVQRFHSLLASFGSENVKEDFRKGQNNAITLTPEELTLVDEFYKLTFENEHKATNEFENALTESVEHLTNLVESKSKSVLTSSYSEIRKLLDKISQSQYWQVRVPQPTVVAETSQQSTSVAQATSSTHEQQQQQQPEQSHLKYQHNTSTDDFVIVTSQEVESNSIEQQQYEQHHQQQQQQQQSGQYIPQSADQRAFFTTLNSDNNASYIQEVINANTEINFLQDSEIQPPHQQQGHDLHQNSHNSYQQGYGNDYGAPHNDDYGGQYQNSGYNNQNINPDNQGRKSYPPRNGNYRGGNRGGPRGGGGGYRGGPRGGGPNQGPRGGYEKRPFKPNNRGGGHYNNRGPQQQQQETMN